MHILQGASDHIEYIRVVLQATQNIDASLPRPRGRQAAVGTGQQDDILPVKIVAIYTTEIM